MKVFHCDHCDQLLFFENLTCVRCGRVLAYVPELSDMISLDRAGDDQWRSPLTSADRTFRLCANYSTHNVCNWAMPSSEPHTLCRACRLTTTIPNLSRPGNDRLWYKLEVAKRRLVYTLDQLGLPLEDTFSNPEHGLAFQFLEDPAPAPGSSCVLTGHDDGTITVNIAEADDAERVRRREELGEPYRTLLGHFRHEVGHYYWDRLIRNSARIESFRALFGDEQTDYKSALERHYQSGAPPNWQNDFVSSYATMHPWEDWAETWAHYLHMTDTLETAAACGISLDPHRDDEPTLKSVPHPATFDAIDFDRVMESWGAITYVMNNLNRGMGYRDAYPFILSQISIRKLRFVHETIYPSMQ